MKKYIISYANSGYYETQKRFVKSIQDKNVSVISYTDKWLKKREIYRDNKFILDQKRGAGYWLWKPYILLETFSKMNDGDLVLYCDADAVVVQSFNSVFDICLQIGGIMIFDTIYTNKSWVKRDCYILMDADSPQYYDAIQAMSGFIVLQKNEKSKKILEEWLQFAKDYRVITDFENELGEPNLPEFIEHRHDQSILSILRVKWNLPIFRDPSQWGNPYKMPAYRLEGEFLAEGRYNEREVKENSAYGTLIDLRPIVMPKLSFVKSLLKKSKRLLHLILK